MDKRVAFSIAILLGMAEPVLAISAFARRYDVACHFCHEGYPKLNAMGQRFKERGFRMEREEDFDAAKWLRSIPLVIRPSANRFFIQDGDGTTTGFIKGISAGSLGGRLSYWVDDGVLITEGDDNFTHIKPDNAWARFEVIPAGKLYVRGGRIEMEIPFTQTRTTHLFSYDVYFANTGFETDSIGFFQDGIEIGGDLPGDTRWSAAVVKGHNSEETEALTDKASDFDANVFLRVSKRFERNRLGAFAYIGRNTLATTVPPIAGQGPTRLLTWDDNLLRLGADANLWFGRFNLYGVYMYGRNDNSIADRDHPSGTGQSLSFNGAFVQGDLHVRDWVVVTTRANLVSQPPGRSGTSNQTFKSLFPGVLFYVKGRLKLSFEYGFLDKDRPDFGAVQVDLVL